MTAVRKLMLVMYLGANIGFTSTVAAEDQRDGGRQPSLIVMAAGAKELREALNPVLDALCEELLTGNHREDDVVRLQPEIEMLSMQLELTPKDSAEEKGAILRQLQGALQAQAFQRCDGTAVRPLVPPLDVLLLRVTYRKEERMNVAVHRYRLDGSLISVEVPKNMHIDLFKDVALLGRCIGRRYRDGNAVEERECRRIDLKLSADMPPVETARKPQILSNGPSKSHLPTTNAVTQPDEISSGLSRQWWFWTVAAVAVLGVSATIYFVADGTPTEYAPRRTSNTPVGVHIVALTHSP